MRYRDLLLGVHFTWCTDHKALTHFMNQRDLTGRQAQWLSKMSEFDFTVEYIPGKDNNIADALSRIYSADAPGTVRSDAEYTQFDKADVRLNAVGTSSAVLAGAEARYSLRPRKPMPPPAVKVPKPVRVKQAKEVAVSPPRPEGQQDPADANVENTDELAKTSTSSSARHRNSRNAGD
jgi:hypothetical protein